MKYAEGQTREMPYIRKAVWFQMTDHELNVDNWDYHYHTVNK
jgi:hypothetical protein